MPLNSKRRQSLLAIVPEGTVISRKQLLESGLERHAIDNLLKGNQLEPHTQGIYGRPGSNLTWQGLVFSLQKMFDDFTVGGLTAIELQGLAHYLPLSDKKTIHLYARQSMPHWVNKLLPKVEFISHNEQALIGRVASTVKSKVEQLSNKEELGRFTSGFTWKEDSPAIRISMPERAYLEILMGVPDKISFEHAEQLMQGLTSLSPRKMQLLLEMCKNIKVRRLFLWFAERSNHAWFKRLDHENIDLGSGNRVLAKGGKLDTKYKITIPENL